MQNPSQAFSYSLVLSWDGGPVHVYPLDVDANTVLPGKSAGHPPGAQTLTCPTTVVLGQTCRVYATIAAQFATVNNLRFQLVRQGWSADVDPALPSSLQPGPNSLWIIQGAQVTAQ